MVTNHFLQYHTTSTISLRDFITVTDQDPFCLLKTLQHSLQATAYSSKLPSFSSDFQKVEPSLRSSLTSVHVIYKLQPIIYPLIFLIFLFVASCAFTQPSPPISPVHVRKPLMHLVITSLTVTAPPSQIFTTAYGTHFSSSYPVLLPMLALPPLPPTLHWSLLVSFQLTLTFVLQM